MLCRECSVIMFFVLYLCETRSEPPPFRVLAPQYVCPKDENTAIEKLDNTVITLQTAPGVDLQVVWTVRWTQLSSPTQRFTIMLWKATRELEKHLNKPPKEPYVYIIDNSELLHGVDYIFNVTSIESDGTKSEPKSFHIDNTYGKRKLDQIEGRSDLLSIILIGGLTTYVDVEFVIVAQITPCTATQDYYLIWTVRRADTHEQVNVTGGRGSILKIPPYSFEAGMSYDINCEVVKESTGLRVTQTGFSIEVLHRDLEVYLNVDNLLVPADKSFYVEALPVNHDYYQEPVNFVWECKSGEDLCDFEASVDNIQFFPSGLPVGEYEIKVTAKVKEQTAYATATLRTVENTLPIIQVIPMNRIINEGNKLLLIANASNVAPTCSLTWYFNAEENILILDEALSGTNVTEHGVVLSDSLTIFSLEENFLNELTDYTNETEWRQVTAETTASSGRARLVAECGCSATFECKTKGLVYADVNFKLNKSPKPGKIIISPTSGTALETVFRISTLAVGDPDAPLRYSFYCRVSINETLLLGSAVEHRAVETFLPYTVGGTEVWAEVCDILGACASGDPYKIHISPGEGATMEAFLVDVAGHLRRCEIMYFKIDVISAIVTYKNANQLEILDRFKTSLLEILATITEDCVNRSYNDYSSLLKWLEEQGFHISGVKE